MKFSPSCFNNFGRLSTFFPEFVHNSIEVFHWLLDTDLRERILIDISGNVIKLYRVAGVQSLVMNKFSRAYFLLSCKTTPTFFVMYLNKSSSVVPMSQCYVIKQMVNAIACTIELQMHLGGLLSTQEARVALGYRLVRLLRFFRA